MPPIDQAIAEDNKPVNHHRERQPRDGGLPERESVSNQPRGVSINELHVDPVDKQRATTQALQPAQDAAAIGRLVEEAVEFAKSGTDPAPEDALKNVYA